jgi:hypothetical protein
MEFWHLATQLIASASALMAARSLGYSPSRHVTLWVLFGLSQWLQFVNDATLVVENSSLTVSSAEAEGGTAAH